MLTVDCYPITLQSNVKVYCNIKNVDYLKLFHIQILTMNTERKSGIMIADAAVVWPPGQAEDGRSEPDRRQWRRNHARQSRVAHQTADRGAGAPTQPQEERRPYFTTEEETPDHVPGLSGKT